jgi:hypothetical protein
MGTALVRGRDCSDRDREGEGRVVIVNETLERDWATNFVRPQVSFN